MSTRGYRRPPRTKYEATGKFTKTRMRDRSPRRPAARKGYPSVARARGAAVTGEMKYFDSELGFAAIPASTDWTATEFDPNTTQEGTPVATILNLFSPVQGAGVNQRIGKRCKLIGIKIRGSIVVAKIANLTAAKTAALIRVIVYQDTQTNAAQAQGENVMTASTTADSGINMMTYQNLNNFGRFKVLMDKTFSLSDPNMTWDGTNIEMNGLSLKWKFNYKFKTPVTVQFNAASSGTVTSIVDNSFHVLANASSADLVPLIGYVCRCTYKE